MKTVEEIYGEMAAVFAEQTGLEIGSAGDLAVRLYAVAAEIYGLYLQAEWVGRQCFPQTASGHYLDLHAALRGVERKTAAKAAGTIRFSVQAAPNADRVIPVGTVCMTAGLVRFETTQVGILEAGNVSVDVPARALETGAQGNVAAGAILTMAVAPAGVAMCGNPAAFTGGADEEDDESLRARVLETYRRLANGANAAYYAQKAMSFDEVAAVNVLPRKRGIGTVDVVIATMAGSPKTALVKEVKAYFEKAREIAVDVNVSGPTRQMINVSVAVKPKESQDSADVLARVSAAIQGWFNGTRLGKPVRRAELGELIYHVEGVENYSLSAPASDVNIASGILPIIGSLSVREMD